MELLVVEVEEEELAAEVNLLNVYKLVVANNSVILLALAVVEVVGVQGLSLVLAEVVQMVEILDL
jgi:hypothetical protein